jgi:hypothetical protein
LAQNRLGEPKFTSLESPENGESEYVFKIFLTCLSIKWQCKTSNQSIKSLCDEISIRQMAMFLMSQRNVGTSGTPAIGYSVKLGAVRNRVKQDKLVWCYKWSVTSQSLSFL